MGSFESKSSSPYYAIIDENPNDDSSVSKTENSNVSNILSNTDLTKQSNDSSQKFWLVKKVKFKNENKKTLLFEFSDEKIGIDVEKKKCIQLALNQIKMLKTLRHPNIVKYIYSEEMPLVNTNNFKCLLITELIRPLTTIFSDLSKEQIIRGVFSITNAISFLHEKASISHNNLNENCIFINGKQEWKLNNFELALPFSKLNRSNLNQIYNFKYKNSITPEEEQTDEDSMTKFDLDSVLKHYPHSIDVYAWSMMLLNLLPKYLTEEIQQLELFLNKDPKCRPTIQDALSMKLFDLYRHLSVTNSLNSSLNHNLAYDKQDNISYVDSNETNSVDLINSNKTNNLDQFKYSDLNELESNLPKLIDYLKFLNKENEPYHKISIDEKLIDFLLSPFMFFSNRFRDEIFPAVFVPKEESTTINTSLKTNEINSFSNHFYSKKSAPKKNSMDSLEPFIQLDKYKAFVLPRILNLFSMRSTQIRLVLLEYFPYFVSHINDMDTLRYEILPELLIGLKENNDHLVSLSFSCLSIMVCLLGNEIVVGREISNNKQRKKYFSDNIPKTVVHKIFIENNKTETSSLNLNTNKITNENKNMLTRSVDDDEILKSMHSNDTESISRDKNKVFSDSMIGLHDDNESNYLGSSKIGFKDVFNSENNNDNNHENIEDDDEDWSNDFGWNSNDAYSNTYSNDLGLKLDTSAASLISLANFDMNQTSNLPLELTSNLKIKNSSNIINRNTTTTNNNNNINNTEMGSEFDIKSITIKKIPKTQNSNVEDLLIENFLNEMEPNLNVKENNVLFETTSAKSNSANNLMMTNKNNVSEKKVTNIIISENNVKNDGGSSWDCDDDINLDEI